MCFAQISFPIDVVHITKIGPLVLIQIHVLQFLFNLKLPEVDKLHNYHRKHIYYFRGTRLTIYDDNMIT